MGKESYALITGLFMAILLAVTVVIAIWLGEVRHQTKTYIAETQDSVTGLRIGSSVYYRGIEVGKVKAIDFDKDNPKFIIVRMDVDGRVKFTRGVYATLELKGVTGLTQIALKDSGDDPRPLPGGDLAVNRIPIRPSLIDRLTVSGEDVIEETSALMVKLNRLLDDENTRHVETILSNVDSATGKFVTLQEDAAKALSEVTLFTADARRTLSEMNSLAGEFKLLSSALRQELTTLSTQSGELLQTGTAVARQLLHTTLPRADIVLLQLQALTNRYDRVGTMLENDPQAFLFGAKAHRPAPGEPGFQESP